jgi:hypothetical protein
MLDRRTFIKVASAVSAFVSGGVAQAARRGRPVKFSLKGLLTNIRPGRRGTWILEISRGGDDFVMELAKSAVIFTQTGDERPRRARRWEIEEDSQVIVDGLRFPDGRRVVRRLTILIPSYSG